jgi:hypothetical protein
MGRMPRTRTTARTTARTGRRVEFGDFQTPAGLAAEVCALLGGKGIAPASLVEPTCGTGTFLTAALKSFPQARQAVGVEIDPAHVARARASLRSVAGSCSTRILQADFFHLDWPRLIAGLSPPLLVLGNPPWVTNAELGTLGSINLPAKSNFQKRPGLEAITGKSNFDISESMLIRLLELLDGKQAILAMLCKTSVARKVLMQTWQRGMAIEQSAIFPIDSEVHFSVSVDACLFFASLQPGKRETTCEVHDGLKLGHPRKRFGLASGRLIADLEHSHIVEQLQGRCAYQWRSGIKHDCARVMELSQRGSQLVNGLDEIVDIEESCVYPMLKSAEVARGPCPSPHRWMLVPQQAIGEDTSRLRHLAPRTWQYLMRHADLLASRKSSIYRQRPPFSVFGVGSYSFAPCKLAISGFYKSLRFSPLACYRGRPVVLDDTSYFLPAQTREEMEFLQSLVGSEPARQFFAALVFWDSKRPITIDLLSRLDLGALAKALGREQEYHSHLAANPWASRGLVAEIPAPTAS